MWVTTVPVIHGHSRWLTGAIHGLTSRWMASCYPSEPGMFPGARLLSDNASCVFAFCFIFPINLLFSLKNMSVYGFFLECLKLLLWKMLNLNMR